MLLAVASWGCSAACPRCRPSSYSVGIQAPPRTCDASTLACVNGWCFGVLSENSVNRTPNQNFIVGSDWSQTSCQGIVTLTWALAQTEIFANERSHGPIVLFVSIDFWVNFGYIFECLYFTAVRKGAICKESFTTVNATGGQLHTAFIAINKYTWYLNLICWSNDTFLLSHITEYFYPIQ